MSRKTNLEQHIRECEDIKRLSDSPKEHAHARRAVEEQWNLIKSYLVVIASCKRDGISWELGRDAQQLVHSIHGWQHKNRTLAFLHQRLG